MPQSCISEVISAFSTSLSLSTVSLFCFCFLPIYMLAKLLFSCYTDFRNPIKSEKLFLHFFPCPVSRNKLPRLGSWGMDPGNLAQPSGGMWSITVRLFLLFLPLTACYTMAFFSKLHGFFFSLLILLMGWLFTDISIWKPEERMENILKLRLWCGSSMLSD